MRKGGYEVLFSKPGRFFLTCGRGEGLTPLNAFDAALWDAGVGDLNLVKVSSILPPRCREDSTPLESGSIVPAAYAYIIGDIPGEVISAAVAVGVPEDPDKPGLIMEYSAKGHRDEAEAIVRRMVEEGMAMRGRRIKEIKSCAVECKVERIGAAFAAVVFGP